MDNENQTKNESILDSENQTKKLGVIHIVLIGLLVATIAAYLTVSCLFFNHFYYGTKINGEDFSFKTFSDVKDFMTNKVDAYKLTLIEKNDINEIIEGKDISLNYDENEIKEALNNQNVLLWPFAYFQKNNTDIKIKAYYDKEKFDETVKALKCSNEAEQTDPINACPVYQEGNFVIKDEEIGTKLDSEKFFNELNNSVTNFLSELNLENTECYLRPKFSSDSPEVKAACDEMNNYCTTSITYNISPETTEVVNNDVISNWLTCDNDMKVSINTESVKNYISDFANKYDTVGKNRTITSPTGKTVEVSGGTYGWKINQEEETNSVVSSIQNKDVISREPIYEQTAAAHNNAEWGSTYLEVDISKQHMWYIKDGSVAMESDVVTGAANRKNRATPSGVYEILEKRSPKVLVGERDANGNPSYQTPVSYWMRVTWSGVGFHDAKWQSRFGGNRYITGYGSHGCINMPSDQAKKLYNMLSCGCPVIIHY